MAGGLVVFVGGVFDMFDGTLARATGRVSKLGAFMDSVFDRWGEALVYVGLVAGLAAAGWPFGPLLAAAAMASAFLVSYARAKSEGLGFSAGTGMAADRGHAPRDPPRDPVRRPRHRGAAQDRAGWRASRPRQPRHRASS